jgi:branched-chain amino acid transport system ATP-binding protein
MTTTTDRPAERPTERRVALAAQGLVVRYGAADGVAAVRSVDVEVAAGEVVALLGPNGAGKTSTLLALAGGLPVAGGQVLVDGAATTAPLHRRARRGLGLLTEERCIFPRLSVRENLRLGRGDPEAALELFPELREHVARPAGLLSGGQQQMLALGRVLAARPTVLLADELSLGLAPVVVSRLLAAVRRAADDGVAVLIVEQHVHLALQVSDRTYVMRRGEIVFTGASAELRDDPDRIGDLYLEAS